LNPGKNAQLHRIFFYENKKIGSYIEEKQGGVISWNYHMIKYLNVKPKINKKEVSSVQK